MPTVANRLEDSSTILWIGISGTTCK